MFNYLQAFRKESLSIFILNMKISIISSLFNFIFHKRGINKLEENPRLFLKTQELKLTFFFLHRTFYLEDQGDLIINFELPRYHLIILLFIYVITVLFIIFYIFHLSPGLILFSIIINLLVFKRILYSACVKFI